MIVLADEGVERHIVAHLRSEGHDVLYVVEMDPGIGDDVVLEIANESFALLLTEDKDFGELVYRQRKVHSGVILVRLEGISVELKAQIVCQALVAREHELAGAFTVISAGRVRIRKRLKRL